MAELHGEIQRSRVFLDRCAQVLKKHGILFYRASTGTIYPIGYDGNDDDYSCRISDHSSANRFGHVQAWDWDRIEWEFSSLPLSEAIRADLIAEIESAKSRLAKAQERGKLLSEKNHQKWLAAVEFAKDFFKADYKKHPELCAKGGEVKHNCARKAQIILADLGCKLSLSTTRNLVDAARRS